MPVRDHNPANTDPALGLFWLGSGMSAKYIKPCFPNKQTKKTQLNRFNFYNEKTYSKNPSAAPKTKLRLNKIYERTA